tara:strand:+ start:56 stop:271 length:216 start_codon:yes stop_codon:yes gene_type:complete
MKTRLVIRDGKVVEIKPEELNEKKGNLLLKEGSKLKWGDKNYQETRISTNERGERRIFKETKKSKHYIKKK